MKSIYTFIKWKYSNVNLTYILFIIHCKVFIFSYLLEKSTKRISIYLNLLISYHFFFSDIEQ